MQTPSCLVLCFLLSLHPLLAHSLSFNITNFAAGTDTILYEGDAAPVSGSMELTPVRDRFRVSRASYADPVRIWDSSTGKVADFTTRFSFRCSTWDANATLGGDGFALFLAPFNDSIPPNSAGENLGLFNMTLPRRQMVTVEFDSHVNAKDPPVTHIGINKGSLVSNAFAGWDFWSARGNQGDAVVTYNATTMNLSLALSYKVAEVEGNSTFLIINLRNAIPEWVRIGFSASTGDFEQQNTISSWQFSSNMDSRVVAASPSRKEKTRITRLLVIVGVSLSGLVLGGVGIALILGKLKRSKIRASGKRNLSDSTNADLGKGALPIRFSFQELVVATNNFADENKLGRGGSGQVYKGLLTNLGRVVAVKRILTESENSEKIFLNEAKIISRLIHRNLVQFIGWCHEGGSLLLVYDYMPNGSLDTHLFGNKISLSWPVRYKIALGLASALHYLHEDAEHCVLHRDIKSANVLLDTDFSTKLGDFGLAKLIDPSIRSQRTTLVGTLGYLAPEYATEGKATKESDMYSFGVVALEIVCGRSTYEDDDGHVPLGKWVLELHSSGNILNAVDESLGGNFDREEIERLLMVGLRCTNRNAKERLEAQQVIKVLRGEMPMLEQPNDLGWFLPSEQQDCMPLSRNHMSSSLCDGR